MLWILCAVAALALAGASVLLGLNILPSVGKASESGTFIPLLVAWGLIAVAVVSALSLAKFVLGNRSGH